MHTWSEIINAVVRPLATITLVGSTCYMALTGLLPPEAFLPLVFLAMNWWNEERKEMHRKELEVKLEEAKAVNMNVDHH